MCIVDQHGELVGTYRKRFLYQTDKAWAEEGDEEFRSFEMLGLKSHATSIERVLGGGSEVAWNFGIVVDSTRRVPRLTSPPAP
mmetsp:Transcript_391/g.475  ORF Transcript_391/g.475 Transcript_391/m.475 type:complete len:83 (-) Transcript_391:1392-1640(-)